MYKKAVTNKTAGGILAINLTIAMIVATAWLARFEPGTLFFTAVCVIFLLCITFSMFGYRMQDGKQYMLGNFQTGMQHRSGEVKDNFETFCDLMYKYWQQPKE